MAVKTIEWVDGKVRIVDQTKLPEELVYLDISNVEVLGEAFRRLRIRGAPALGIAGAMGVALVAHGYRKDDGRGLVRKVREAIAFLRSTRPTAINLFWALDRMERVVDKVEDEPVERIREKLLQEALTIMEEDRTICRRIGQSGAVLIPE